MTRPIPDVVPVFPLPGAVFFPATVFPLHVFEPRYREMTTDLLAGVPILVMALLQPGWEDDYEGRPPVHPIGCAAEIVHSHQLPDGRWYLTMRGVARVRIEEEFDGRPYRLARVAPLPERDERLRTEAGGALLTRILDRFHELNEGVEIVTGGVDPGVDPDVREVALNTVATHLTVPPETRQALLELDDLAGRGERVEAILDQALRERRIIDGFRHRKPEDPTQN